MIAAALQEYPQLSVRGLCELVGVDRSWYYQRPAAEEVAWRDVELRDAIERIVLEFPGYGYRRVTEELHRQEWDVNHKRVLRVMREESLLCQIGRRFVVTTDSAHGHMTYPNLLKGLVLGGLNEAWAADITYIRLPESFVYLAAILDAYSRRCIGWELSRFIDTRPALAALEMAIEQRRPPLYVRLPPDAPFGEGCMRKLEKGSSPPTARPFPRDRPSPASVLGHNRS